ncbi:Uncharacterised protein [Chlamydia trachomatis]|nr:Uncharacterised protein [Chlamydia trachomatis]
MGAPLLAVENALASSHEASRSVMNLVNLFREDRHELAHTDNKTVTVSVLVRYRLTRCAHRVTRAEPAKSGAM